MTTGLTRDLREVDDARKSAVINNELLRLGVDMAALQETALRKPVPSEKRITPSSGTARLRMRQESTASALPSRTHCLV